MPGFRDTTAYKPLVVVAISAALTLFFGAIALLFPRAADNFFRRIERSFPDSRKRKRLAVIVLFLSVIALRL